MVDHAVALNQIKRILRKDGRIYLSISRFGRKSDPRSVTAEEWQRVLGGFRVMESGLSLFSRWAVLSRANGESSANRGESNLTGLLACTCN